MLSSDYSEWLHRQVMILSDAESLVQQAHVTALRQIGVKLASTDPVAREFVDRVDASITQPYQFSDTLNAARMLAPSFLRRLEKEKDAAQNEANRDPVGKTRRDYLKARAVYDPFCADANVAIDGLLEIPKQKFALIHSMGLFSGNDF